MGVVSACCLSEMGMGLPKVVAAFQQIKLREVYTNDDGAEKIRWGSLALWIQGHNSVGTVTDDKPWLRVLQGVVCMRFKCSYNAKVGYLGAGYSGAVCKRPNWSECNMLRPKCG